MKNKKSFPNYFFHPNLPCLQAGSSGLIIILLLFFSAITTAQEQTQSEDFQIGATLGEYPYNLVPTYNSYLDCGFTDIFWETYPYTEEYINSFNGDIISGNGHSRLDYIAHYATGYYSKWEAEQNQLESNRVGVKHDGGKSAFWYDSELNDSVLCWSSEDISAPACSLVYGPHYRQEKRYKRWYNESGFDRFNLSYTVRYRMALSNPHSVSGSEDVCKIMVVYKYTEEYSNNTWNYAQDTFLVKTLKVQDFLQSGEFSNFYFDSTYTYPAKFRPPEIGDTDYRFKLETPKPQPIAYNDTEAGVGIQFCIDWLRDDDSCTLYVDYMEVYDNDGWNYYLEDPENISYQIKKYAADYQAEYPNIKYWYVHDEPYTLDAFIPFHTVDSIVRDTVDTRLITRFYPYWTHDGKINGEDFLQQWYDIAQPQKLMFDFYPFSPDYPFRFTDVEELRLRLQKCSELQPGFWYSAQGFGFIVGENGP